MSGKAIRETLAALGVIASMVFVGMELRQNNDLARAEAYQAMGGAIGDLMREVSLNPEFAEIHRRFVTDTLSSEDLADFTDTQRYQMVASWVGALRAMEVNWRLRELGLLEEEAFGYFGINSPGVALAAQNLQLIWDEVGAFMSPDFAAYLESSWTATPRRD